MRSIAVVTAGGLALLVLSGNVGWWLAVHAPGRLADPIFTTVNVLACAILGCLVGRLSRTYWPTVAVPIALYHLTVSVFVIRAVMIWHAMEFLLWISVGLASAWLCANR